MRSNTFGGAVNSKDIESIHQFMSATALQNADKYLEEARSVKDGDSEFPNTKENVNPQEKRPALVRKRAKFSMKPNASQPSTILEPTLQMDQLRELRDPAEFFAAVEKLEKAKKEIRRQRGEDPNETRVSTTTTVRQRRPELPRRKTSYKHHVYSSQPESDTSFAQETLQNDVGSPPTFYSQQEPVIANCESQEEDVVGSVPEIEDRVDKIFNHLMATCNNDNLDDKGRLSYLEECLNAKPPEITELNLPDFNIMQQMIKQDEEKEVAEAGVDVDVVKNGQFDQGSLDTKDDVSGTGDWLPPNDAGPNNPSSPALKRASETSEKELTSDHSSTKCKNVKVKIEKP